MKRTSGKGCRHNFKLTPKINEKKKGLFFFFFARTFLWASDLLAVVLSKTEWPGC